MAKPKEFSKEELQNTIATGLATLFGMYGVTIFDSADLYNISAIIAMFIILAWKYYIRKLE